MLLRYKKKKNNKHNKTNEQNKGKKLGLWLTFNIQMTKILSGSSFSVYYQLAICVWISIIIFYLPFSTDWLLRTLCICSVLWSLSSMYWYYHCVCLSIHIGIIMRKSDGKFRPNSGRSWAKATYFVLLFINLLFIYLLMYSFIYLFIYFLSLFIYSINLLIYSFIQLSIYLSIYSSWHILIKFSTKLFSFNIFIVMHTLYKLDFSTESTGVVNVIILIIITYIVFFFFFGVL